MGVFDQAARYATQVESEAVLSRLLSGTGAVLRLREWVDTRTTPRPGERDRTADLVAALVNESQPDQPWLLIFEFQAQHDPDKLDVTLAEVARLRMTVRHGDDRRGKYNVCPALVYLRGRYLPDVLDMTLPDGHGTRHAPLVWDLEGDSAAAALASVAAGQASWGLLFWIALMQGGGEVATIARWRELASAVPDARGDLGVVALVFAQLAMCFPAWDKGLEDWEMTESIIVNRLTEKARREASLVTRREDVLEAVQTRFPGAIPAEVVELIRRQDSEEVLKEWFQTAIAAPSAEEFLDVVRR